MNERKFFDTDWHKSRLTLKYIKHRVYCGPCATLCVTLRKVN